MAPRGTTIHIPPGVPHGCAVNGRQGVRMLMIYQPSGFDLFMSELEALSESDINDPSVIHALEEKYDIVQLGPLPSLPDP